jgi:hypothetical protein
MHKQSSIIVGIVLILAGLLFLILQAFPDLAAQIDFGSYWPLILVGIGGLLLLSALVGTAELAVPGSVLTGIGLLLTYQNASGNWASWSYAWALIPGFVGIGIMLMGWLDAAHRHQVREGFRLLLISLGLFVIFGGFFGAFGQFWPVLLILGGVFLLFRGRLAGGTQKSAVTPPDKHR